MIDKKELISTYLQQFGSHYQTIETAKLMLLVNCTLIFLNKMD